VLVPELPFPKLLPGFLIASGRLKPETETKAPIWVADVIIAGPTARSLSAAGLGADSRQKAPQPSLLPAILRPDPAEAVRSGEATAADASSEDTKPTNLTATVAPDSPIPDLPAGNPVTSTVTLPPITSYGADASVKVTRGHILRTQHNSNLDHRAPQQDSSPGDDTTQRCTAKPTSTKGRALSQGCVSSVALLSQLHSAESRPVTGGRSQTRGKTIWIRPTTSTSLRSPSDLPPLQSSKSANVLQLPTAKAQHSGTSSTPVACAKSTARTSRVVCKLDHTIIKK
jgi:hypothetical protein